MRMSLRKAVVRVMRVERDHAVECHMNGQSSPETQEEMVNAWYELRKFMDAWEAFLRGIEKKKDVAE